MPSWWQHQHPAGSSRTRDPLPAPGHTPGLVQHPRGGTGGHSQGCCSTLQTRTGEKALLCWLEACFIANNLGCKKSLHFFLKFLIFVRFVSVFPIIPSSRLCPWQGAGCEDRGWQRAWAPKWVWVNMHVPGRAALPPLLPPALPPPLPLQVSTHCLDALPFLELQRLLPALSAS